MLIPVVYHDHKKIRCVPGHHLFRSFVQGVQILETVIVKSFTIFNDKFYHINFKILRS